LVQELSSMDTDMILGQASVPRGLLSGEAKFGVAKREAKPVPASQTMVPVTGVAGSIHSWWARQGSNLQGLLHWILSPARLPIPPRARFADLFLHLPAAVKRRGKEISQFSSRRQGAAPLVLLIILGLKSRSD
jgi:hypothetical protein